MFDDFKMLPFMVAVRHLENGTLLGTLLDVEFNAFFRFVFCQTRVVHFRIDSILFQRNNDCKKIPWKMFRSFALDTTNQISLNTSIFIESSDLPKSWPSSFPSPLATRCVASSVSCPRIASHATAFHRAQISKTWPRRWSKMMTRAQRLTWFLRFKKRNRDVISGKSLEKWRYFNLMEYYKLLLFTDTHFFENNLSMYA